MFPKVQQSHQKFAFSSKISSKHLIFRFRYGGQTSWVRTKLAYGFEIANAVVLFAVGTNDWLKPEYFTKRFENIATRLFSNFVSVSTISFFEVTFQIC